MPVTSSPPAARPRCRPLFRHALLATLLAAVASVVVLDGWPARAVDYVAHVGYCLKVGDYTRNSVASYTCPDGSVVTVVT
jgi:hypothetical protein